MRRSFAVIAREKLVLLERLGDPGLKIDAIAPKILDSLMQLFPGAERAFLILVEADNLDGALAIAGDLLAQTRPGTAIEVRPVLDGRFRGA